MSETFKKMLADVGVTDMYGSYIGDPIAAAKWLCSEIDSLRAEVATLRGTKGGDLPEPRREAGPDGDSRKPRESVTTDARTTEGFNVTPPPVGTAGGDWRRFPDELPPERRHVLVRLTEIPCGDPSGLGGIPASVAGGYLRFAAGDEDSPYFVTPGISQKARTVTHWCNCLPDWMQVFDYAGKAEKYEAPQKPLGHIVPTGQPMYKCKREGCEVTWSGPRYCVGCETKEEEFRAGLPTKAMRLVCRGWETDRGILYFTADGMAWAWDSVEESDAYRSPLDYQSCFGRLADFRYRPRWKTWAEVERMATEQTK